MNVAIPPTPAQRLADRSHPAGHVVLKQRWEHLLFMHWKMDPITVQASLPAGLTVDTHDGVAWLGLVPLFMRRVRPSFVPPIPFVSSFHELNLRTYVYDSAGRPGVYFYSLDCDQPLVVETARRLLNLRYEHSNMNAKVDDTGGVTLASQRKGTAIASKYRYLALGEPELAAADSLEFFLVERYRLFAAGENSLTAIRILHAPYRLREALVFEWDDGPARLAGFHLHGRAPDHIRAAEPLDVDTFAPEPVELG